MSSAAQAEAQTEAPGGARRSAAMWLQTLTILWLLVECTVALYAAITARSAAVAAFGSDSLVELLSATMVLGQWIPGIRLSERVAARTAAVLLGVLALAVTVLAVCSLLFHVRAETSGAGLAITAAALVVMPVLAALKRREARRSGNRAMAADAVQSATCAYLALLTLAGMGANALWHVGWVDSAAALLAVPLLAKEAREAWEGTACGCC